MRKQTVFIIGGGGMVGATAAQAIALKEIAHDVVLIDVAAELVHGQAMDLNHATAYSDGVQVRVGDYDEIQDDDIVVITCGIAQKPGQTRLELLQVNAAIITDVVRKVTADGRQPYILMVANPVDVLTYVALKESGLPKERVFGTGTSLDTARLRVLLGQALGVSQKSVQAYILGEHGDSSFAGLSHASVGGVPLTLMPGFKPSITARIEDDIREAAYKIIDAKRATYYGIGHVVAQIVAAIMRNTASIYPACSLAEGEYGLDGVVLGLPSLVSSRGAQILEGYPLSEAEKERLHASAAVIRNAIDSLSLEPAAVPA